MRRRFVLLVLLALVSALACRPPRTPLAFHDARSFPAETGKAVEVDARSLDVEVTVQPGESIAVKVDLEARASSRTAAARWVERSKPVYADSAGRLEIRVPSGRRNVMMIGYFQTRGTIQVTLPPHCRLEVHTASGDVVLDGDQVLSEPVRVETSSGDVRVAGGVGRLVVETASGDVRVTGGDVDGVEAQTASGDVEVRTAVRRVQVDTASGDLRLDRLLGELSVHTASGDVRATWREAGNATRAVVSTASGDVTLRLPRDASITGKVSTSSGHIRSDFPGSFGRRERTFTLGGQGGSADAPAGGADEESTPERRPEPSGAAAKVEVETSSGDITLHRS
jgi:hypothetical protein